MEVTKPKMVTFEVDEERDQRRSLLPKIRRRIRSRDPVVSTRQRYQTLPGIVIATILFMWWSCTAIPAILNFRKGADVVGPNAVKDVDFDDIIPSEKLEWHSCYGELKCARLTVPMDYDRPLNESQSNPKVHLALILKPGTHTGSKKFSKSPLILNPGGPGGSGVDLVVIYGKQIQTIVGADQDLVSFDPRGIGSTMPRADCFSYPYESPDKRSADPTQEDYARGDFHRLLFTLPLEGAGLVNSTDGALKDLNSRAKTKAKLCKEKDSLLGRDSIFKYAQTPSTARDMLSIVDAWDEWTESSVDGQSAILQPEKGSKKIGSLADTKGQLVYWGFSYGTMLGAQFASMFPSRVGRIILDGVVDYNGYLEPIWTNSIEDTDAVLSSFFTYCHQAGPRCQLYKANDTVSDIQARFDIAMEKLKENPIEVVLEDTKTPLTITHSSIRGQLFLALYSPTAMFPAVATLVWLIYWDLTDLLSGGATPPSFDLKPLCAPPKSARNYNSEAQIAIMCGDKTNPLNYTLPELEDQYASLSSLSSFSDVWLSVMLACSSYSIPATTTPSPWPDSTPINTSFPLLFISNTYDPVTPLSAGKHMASKFVDAGLIEQKSTGHCSILGGVSRCTIEMVRLYLREGIVPSFDTENGKEGKWKQCEVDEWPWHPFNGSEWAIRSEVDEDVEIMEVQRMVAAKELQGAFKEIDFWGVKGGLGMGMPGKGWDLETLVDGLAV